ncbi:hypothetical protein FGO68_gene11681 [Halteria grandinella]|uniref:Uncharacterized protein n=1 Tax=Halteria grandinella TaxID=5974 RepID=A0A8J8P851_HALGN|nr:hypothetical protein FGO68_gene11681 [Halteria grandinella]
MQITIRSCRVTAHFIVLRARLGRLRILIQANSIKRECETKLHSHSESSQDLKKSQARSLFKELDSPFTILGGLAAVCVNSRGENTGKQGAQQRAKVEGKL